MTIVAAVPIFRLKDKRHFLAPEKLGMPNEARSNWACAEAAGRQGVEQKGEDKSPKILRRQF